MVEVLRPLNLSSGLNWLNDKNALIMAGGTDLMVHYRNYSGTSSKIDRPVLFTDNIEELKTVKIHDKTIEIGAAVLLSQLEINEDIPALLRKSCSEIAAPALRNRATLAGNLCNASPAGDTLPPLFLYDCKVTLMKASGSRILNLEDFIIGPGKTLLEKGEMLTSISLSKEGNENIYYRKIGTRAANALSKLSIAAYARESHGVVDDIRLALGAVSPVILRKRDLEKSIIGKTLKELDIQAIKKLYEPFIKPIDDQRSTAKYRKNVALNLIGDFLEQLQTGSVVFKANFTTKGRWLK